MTSRPKSDESEESRSSPAALNGASDSPHEGQKFSLDDIVKRRALLIPSNEIYGTFAGFYDYGPLGKRLKQNIENLWRTMFIQEDGFYEIETVTVLPEIVLKASGHCDHFSDPLVECTRCAKRFRADEAVNNACPECGGSLTEPKQFNLMFKTNIGSLEGNTAYLRPETAQGIFIDFHRCFHAFGQRLPLGLAQVGRSYRNEISPRRGLIRLREFTQMEIEFFFDPETKTYERFSRVADVPLRILTRDAQERNSQEVVTMTAREAVETLLPNEYLGYFLAREVMFFSRLGIPEDRMRIRHMPLSETPHYSGGNFDFEIETSLGWIEVVGNAYRTDYDLSRHAQMSKKSMEIVYNNRAFVPHVVEPSIGLDRTLWCVLEYAYCTEGKAWSYLKFPPAIAPYPVAVLPLMKKDELVSKAQEIVEILRAHFYTLYDTSGSIGKRYARADEAGVPYCVTIDYDTLEGKGVTIRFRDDGAQERVDEKQLVKKIASYISQGKTTKTVKRKTKSKS